MLHRRTLCYPGGLLGASVPLVPHRRACVWSKPCGNGKPGIGVGSHGLSVPCVPIGPFDLHGARGVGCVTPGRGCH